MSNTLPDCVECGSPIESATRPPVYLTDGADGVPLLTSGPLVNAHPCGHSVPINVWRAARTVQEYRDGLRAAVETV